MRAEFAYEEAQKYLRQRNWLALVAGGLAVTTLFGVGAAATRDREVVLVPVTSERLSRHEAAIGRLARISDISFADAAPKASAQLVIGEATACLPLGELIDLAAEAARLRKEIAKASDEIARIEKKLSNEKFVANAPEEIVAAEREKLDEYRATSERLETALSRVSGD